MSTITIRGSVDKPFGILANDAVLPFEMDSRVYQSVVNYVYANLLPNSIFREELALAAPDTVLSSFVRIQNMFEKSTLQSSAHLAITEKVKQYPEFLESLMKTGTRSIVYRSENNFLGVDDTGVGDNIYGHALEQVRNEIRAVETTANTNSEIYTSYIAESNLKKAFYKHNLEKYISKDKKRTIKRLVEMLVRDYGKTEVYSNAPDMETVLVLHKKRNVMDYTDPNALIRIVRKNTIKSVLKLNSTKLRYNALSAFADYIVSKDVTLSEQESADIKIQLVNITVSKQEAFTKRIMDLYSARALPEEVRRAIKNFRSAWYFPTEAEIEAFETESVKLPKLPTHTDRRASTDQTVNVNGDDVLSPTYTCAIVVHDSVFPSISHYMAFELSGVFDPTDPQANYNNIVRSRLTNLTGFGGSLTPFLEARKSVFLEQAISVKSKDYRIKTLLYSVKELTFKDEFDLGETQQFYEAHKDNDVLIIRSLSSLDDLVENDAFTTTVIEDKVDFYFNLIENLMLHARAKDLVAVTYDEIVALSPFYDKSLFGADQPRARIPPYLENRCRLVGMSNESVSTIWKIIFYGLKQAEKITQPKGVQDNYDLRYKCLFIWSKYLLGKSIGNLRRLEVLNNRKEDIILLTLCTILNELVDVNVALGSTTLDARDLDTAVHLCLGMPREAKLQVWRNPGDAFEGFTAASGKKFNAFLRNHFGDKIEYNLYMNQLEEAVHDVLSYQMPRTLKNQIVNFFSKGSAMTTSLEKFLKSPRAAV
jgi:predicted NAD-dependent protein-ADP-ribosyltransferase YbiA (DUF1768 family)